MFAVEIYAAVRRFVFVERKSRREAARVFGLSRDTIAKMCRYSAPPGYVRSKAPERPKLGLLVPVIDAILESDKTAPPKQRHTAKRVFATSWSRASSTRSRSSAACERRLVRPRGYPALRACDVRRGAAASAPGALGQPLYHRPDAWPRRGRVRLHERGVAVNYRTARWEKRKWPDSTERLRSSPVPPVASARTSRCILRPKVASP
jgi:hypothetical protein